jgi:aryl-alcohol dehydrogenase-like predicted oxidoreductase
MEQRRLGQQGPDVSAQGLGCMGMTFAYGPADETEAVATVQRALDLGVSLIDTADMYGPHTGETLVGNALRGRRAEVTLASKVGNEIDADGALTGRLNGRPEYLRQAVEGSLRRLRTDHLDLYYLHRVDPQVPVEESVGAMADLVRAGKVRHLGLSEASPQSIRRAHATHPLTAVQTEYSLFTRDVEENGVLATTRELGIGFVAYSPLGRGLLTDVRIPAGSLPASDFRSYVPRFHGENLDANERVTGQVATVARDLGIGVAQLAIAWVLAQGPDIVAIPGTKRRSYLEQNLKAADVVLEPATLATLDVLAPHGVARGERYPAAAMAHIDS